MTNGRYTDPPGHADADGPSTTERAPTEPAGHCSDTSTTPQAPPVRQTRLDSADASCEPNSHTGEDVADPGPRSTPARWWVAVLVGLIFAMPFAWLLSYAGMLPFYLGLFFFVLFGVMIGAVIHRVASPSRPYNRWAVLAGTTIVVLTTWLFSLVKESRDFPHDVAVNAGNQTRSIGDQTIQEFRAAVEEDVRRFLRQSYPPGGTIGYVRWIFLSGELEREQIAGMRRPMQRPQRGYIWAIRVVLSLALLAYGVGSQTFLLKRSQDRRPDPEDADATPEPG